MLSAILLLAFLQATTVKHEVTVPLSAADVQALSIASGKIKAVERYLIVLKSHNADPATIQLEENHLGDLQRELTDLEMREINEHRPKDLPQPECEGIKAYFSPDGKYHQELRHDPKGYIGHINDSFVVFDKGFLDCHSD
jgi:hypothetical protein